MQPALCIGVSQEDSVLLAGGQSKILGGHVVVLEDISNFSSHCYHFYKYFYVMGLVGSQFSPQNGGHFGGQTATWRIWRTK